MDTVISATHTLDSRVRSCWFEIMWASLGWSLCLQSWWYYRFLHSNRGFRNTMIAQWLWTRRNRSWVASIVILGAVTLNHEGLTLLDLFFHVVSPSFKKTLTDDNLYEKGIWKRMNICVCRTESLCCALETNRTLLIKYAPMYNTKLKRKKEKPCILTLSTLIAKPQVC